MQSFPSSLFLPSVNAPRIYLTLSPNQEKTSTILPTIASAMVMPPNGLISFINIQTAFPSKSCAKNPLPSSLWAKDFDLNIAHSKASLDRLNFITITLVTLSKMILSGPVTFSGHLQALLAKRGGFAIDTLNTQPLNAFTVQTFDTCKRSTVSRAVGAESQTRPF